MKRGEGREERERQTLMTCHIITLVMCRCPVCQLHYTCSDQLLEHMVLQHAQHLQTVHASATQQQVLSSCDSTITVIYFIVKFINIFLKISFFSF